MSSFNFTYLVGNLVGDPELRFTPSRKAVLSFMLDVESESANIIPIQVWGSLAELCNIRLQKDSRIYLEGVLLVGDKTSVSNTLNFEDEEKYVEEEWYGEEIYVEEDYYSVRVVANKVKILGDQQQIVPTDKYKDKVEDIIQFLIKSASDPCEDHMLMLYLIERLTSIVFENSDD